MTESRRTLPPDQPTLRKISVDEFLLLDGEGCFDDVSVELIDGVIYEKGLLPVSHGRAAMQLLVALDAAAATLRGELTTLGPVSVRLDGWSLPDVDMALAVDAHQDFVTPITARLLIEVAVTSLTHDLTVKKPLYARCGIPELWVADVERRVLLRFHAPAGEDYAERAEFAFGEPVPSATIAGLIVDTARLAAR